MGSALGRAVFAVVLVALIACPRSAAADTRGLVMGQDWFFRLGERTDEMLGMAEAFAAIPDEPSRRDRTRPVAVDADLGIGPDAAALMEQSQEIALALPSTSVLRDSPRDLFCHSPLGSWILLRESGLPLCRDCSWLLAEPPHHNGSQASDHGWFLPPPLRLMTFNLRVGYIPEGEHGWEFRRPVVVELIRKYRPQVVGTQECTAFQAAELRRDLPEYQTVGKAKQGTELSGMLNVVFYRPDELELLARGIFWLSDEPDRPASKGWGNEFPRTALWCRFRRVRDGLEFLFCDTHLDNACEESRAKSAELLVQRLPGLAAGAPIFVTGDFNCGTESAAFRTMTAGLGLTDLLGTLYPDAHDLGTYHAFTGDAGAHRIDFIFGSPNFRPVRGEVVHDARGRCFPSDHFPVYIEASFEF